MKENNTWTETLSDDVVILFNPTRTPNRITIQKRGETPTHLDYPKITYKEICRARAIAKEAFKL